MFRPFLPCGFAYGFAYGIPCSFSGGRHPAGLFVLYHIGAVLVNRFRQNFGGICLFPAPGGAPVSGGIAPALQARRALAAPCGAEPQRHLFTLPRGRGPSQTPPSLATDSSISPGPPSPWLPALSPVNKQEPLVVQVPSLAQARGCKGRSPLHKKTKNLPLPAGKGAGGMGAAK